MSFESLLVLLPRRTRFLGLVLFLTVVIVFKDHILPQSSLDSIESFQAQYRRRSSPRHQLQDGLLYASGPEEEHPISLLTRQAKLNWEAKVASQSKTVEEVSIP